MPSQIGQVVIALISVAQPGQARCGGKDGADRGKGPSLEFAECLIRGFPPLLRKDGALAGLLGKVCGGL
jgi:hypothetical protein